jgi:hypothetical protein
MSHDRMENHACVTVTQISGNQAGVVVQGAFVPLLLWGVKSFAKRASPRLSLLLPLHLRSNATDTTMMEIPYKFDKFVPLMFATHI